jgi:hypothetical protein
VPGGIPLRGLGYFIATLLFVVLGGRLPGVAALLGLLSAPLRYVVVPLAVAVLGTQVAPDGRSAHRFAWDWVRLRVRARRRCAGRIVALEGEPLGWDAVLPVCWDGHGARLRRARVRGPVRVTFAVPVCLRGAGCRVVARPAPEGEPGQPVVLGRGEVLEVRL